MLEIEVSFKKENPRLFLPHNQTCNHILFDVAVVDWSPILSILLVYFGGGYFILGPPLFPGPFPHGMDKMPFWRKTLWTRKIHAILSCNGILVMMNCLLHTLQPVWAGLIILNFVHSYSDYENLAWGRDYSRWLKLLSSSHFPSDCSGNRDSGVIWRSDMSAV